MGQYNNTECKYRFTRVYVLLLNIIQHHRLSIYGTLQKLHLLQIFLQIQVVLNGFQMILMEHLQKHILSLQISQIITEIFSKFQIINQVNQDLIN